MKVGDRLALEASVFGRYIVGEVPSATATELYVRVVRGHEETLAANDRRLLSLILRHPWTVSWIDAGLAIVNPHSKVRHRLHTMFAILESMPEYADYFLPRQRSPFYIVIIAFATIRGGFKAVLGGLFVKILS